MFYCIGLFCRTGYEPYGIRILGRISNDGRAPERRTWLSRKIKIQWHDYKEYVSAEKEDVFLKTLSREYALSRNVLMASIVLMIFALAVGNSVVGITCLAILFVFYLSVRKHAKKLSERINIALHN